MFSNILCRFAVCGIVFSWILLWNCSCSSYFQAEDEIMDYTSLYRERISKVREERFQKRKILTFCCTDDFPVSLRNALQKELEKEQIFLEILVAGDDPSLPGSFLRRGRVDLIAGVFTPEQVREWKLFPALNLPGISGNKSYCLAIRQGDLYLENLLKKIRLLPEEKMEKEEKNNGLKNKSSRQGSFRKKS